MVIRNGYAALMVDVAEALPEDMGALQHELERTRHENHELKKELAWYREQHRLSQAKRFGAASDTPPEQHGRIRGRGEFGVGVVISRMARPRRTMMPRIASRATATNPQRIRGRQRPGKAAHSSG
jgi:hypothetical protein